MGEYNQFESGDMIQISIERTIGRNYHNKETLRIIYMSREQYQSIRWRWYIPYVTAVYQIKYPKESILTGYFHYTVKNGTKEQIDFKLRGKKANLTKWKNRIEEYKKQYIPTLLCPEVENDPSYLAAMDKIRRLEIELEDIQHGKSS